VDGTLKLNLLKLILVDKGNFKRSNLLCQRDHLLLSNQISIGIVCPDLTNWYDNLSPKNKWEVFYEYQTDGADTNDGGST
jgi:hypothetical protein